MFKSHRRNQCCRVFSERFIGDPVLPNLLPFYAGHCTNPLVVARIKAISVCCFVAAHVSQPHSNMLLTIAEKRQRRQIFRLRCLRLQNTPALREPTALEACWIQRKMSASSERSEDVIVRIDWYMICIPLHSE